MDKTDDDMHRSLFSDPLSHNSTEEMDKWTLEFRKMMPDELLKEAKEWIEIEFEGFKKSKYERPSRESLGKNYGIIIGDLAEKLEKMVEEKKNIPPDFLAGLQSILGDVRTCSCCGSISKKAETALIEKAQKAQELLQ
jgi:hypothetical protein